MNSRQIFKAGFAIPQYGAFHYTFLYKTEEYTLPHDALALQEFEGWKVAPIDKVRELVKLYG
jgi:hypothetical protein